MSYGVSITEDGTVLNTAGKYLDQDIAIGMSDSIKLPAQTYNPSTTDQVIPAGKFLSGAQTFKACAGTKQITENGTVDVAGYASAAVNVPQGEIHAKTLKFNIPSDITAGGLKTLVVADADLAMHRLDSTFGLMIFCLNGFQNKSALHQIFATNYGYDGTYGNAIRGTASATVPSYGNDVPVSELPTTYSSSGQLHVNSDGGIQLWMTSSYPLRAGDYIAVASWRE